MTCAIPRGSLGKSFQTKSVSENPILTNILVTSPSAQTCARNLDTITLECQILTVAIFMSAYSKQCCYQSDYLWKMLPKGGHPWLRWLFNDEANIDWLKDYGVLLLVEYGQRTSLQHKGSKYIYNFLEDFGPSVGLEPKAFLNRAWDDIFDFRYCPDPTQGYRYFLNARWTVNNRKLTWGNRMPPAWFIEEQLKRAGKEVDALLN